MGRIQGKMLEKLKSCTASTYNFCVFSVNDFDTSVTDMEISEKIVNLRAVKTVAWFDYRLRYKFSTHLYLRLTTQVFLSGCNYKKEVVKNNFISSDLFLTPPSGFNAVNFWWPLW